MIAYCEKADRTQLLGPGKRAVLWVHGCCFDCPGCIAVNFRTGPYQTESAEALARWYLNTGAEGLTISGGEPMLQADALSRMIGRIRETQDAGVIVYTGFTYEVLQKAAREKPEIAAFLSCIDLLIDGPYLQEEDHNEPFRGSANQRILQLTDRYQREAPEYYEAKTGRRIELQILRGKTRMIGVPSREQAALWEQIKRLGQQDTTGSDETAGKNGG